MFFASPSFLAFFCVAFALYTAARTQRARLFVLLGCSVFYYASWGLQYLLILAVSVGLAVSFVPILRSAAPGWVRKRVLVVGITVQVGLLVVFKYTSFFATNAN